MIQSSDEPSSISPLKIVGLFAGIGGFELGLKQSGHDVLMLCENDPAADRVLAERFGEAERRPDVRAHRSLPPETSLLTAGFPCQDLSQAGRGMGLNGQNSGLVGEVFRRLRRKRVPWVLLENVPFMLRLSRGWAMRLILNELERLGYRWAYRVIDSRAFGLPQRRERVFILATTVGDPRDVLLSGSHTVEIPRALNGHRLPFGFYWTEGNRGIGGAIDAIPPLKGGSGLGIPSPPAIWLPDVQPSIVTPGIEDAEALQGFPRGWTRPAESVGRSSARWRLIGNAVTVPVAAWIGYRLRQPMGYDACDDRPLARDEKLPLAAWNIGHGTYVADTTTWPIKKEQKSLLEYLESPRPLSIRATASFRARLLRSIENRHLRPPVALLKALEAHETWKPK